MTGPSSEIVMSDPANRFSTLSEMSVTVRSVGATTSPKNNEPRLSRRPDTWNEMPVAPKPNGGATVSLDRGSRMTTSPPMNRLPAAVTWAATTPANEKPAGHDWTLDGIFVVALGIPLILTILTLVDIAVGKHTSKHE